MTDKTLTDDRIRELAARYEVGERSSNNWGFAWHDFARAIESELHASVGAAAAGAPSEALRKLVRTLRLYGSFPSDVLPALKEAEAVLAAEPGSVHQVSAVQGETRTGDAPKNTGSQSVHLTSAVPSEGVSALPPEIAAIIERLHTQDNRITDNPLFAVQQRRLIAGLEDGYEEAHEWINEDYETIRDAEKIAALEAAHHEGADTPGARRIGVAWRWEFVTGCLTEQGCKDFIACNGHNLNEPRIYAYGSYRNAEFIALRKWLMALRPPASGAADTDRQGSDETESAAGAHPSADGLSLKVLTDALVACEVVHYEAVADAEGYDAGVTLGRIKRLHKRLADGVEGLKR
jgi:hypothetical protein